MQCHLDIDSTFHLLQIGNDCVTLFSFVKHRSLHFNNEDARFHVAHQIVAVPGPFWPRWLHWLHWLHWLVWLVLFNWLVLFGWSGPFGWFHVCFLVCSHCDHGDGCGHCGIFQNMTHNHTTCKHLHHFMPYNNPCQAMPCHAHHPSQTSPSAVTHMLLDMLVAAWQVCQAQ